MSAVSTDRWTCPHCDRTTVVNGSEVDVRCAIAAVRQRHSDGHTVAADVISHLGLPDPIPLKQPTTIRRRRGRGRAC